MGHRQGWRGRGRLAMRRRRLAALQHRPPAHAVGSELRPPRVVEVEDVHRLSHAAAVGQPRRAPRPRVRHPRGQHAPRQALPAHAAHVSQPAQLPARDVEVDRVEPQLLHQLHRRDAVLPRVLPRDAAHGAQALRVEDAQPLQQLLGEAPALAAVEEDGEDERLVDRRLGGPRDGRGGEEALAQRAEGLARRGDPRLHRERVGAVSRDVVAQVGELGHDRHRAPRRQLHVREVRAVVGGAVRVGVRRRRAEEDLRLGVLAWHAGVHLHAPVCEVRHQRRRLLLHVAARAEEQRRVVGVLGVVEDDLLRAGRVGATPRQHVVGQRHEDARLARRARRQRRRRRRRRWQRQQRLGRSIRRWRGRRRRRGLDSVAPRDARPRAPAAARGPRRLQRKSAWQHGSARWHCSSRVASRAAGSLLARRRRCSSGARPAPAPPRSRARTGSVPLGTKRAVTAVVAAVPRGQLVGPPAR
mmetsp:Transcript_20662/g.52465  ORF Transcript_20662/g.52465 Transcript_20662/m.52465 type:complete len:470 (+) Transcript_20662:298-1707(+)